MKFVSYIIKMNYKEMKQSILITGVLALMTFELSAQGKLPERKAPVYNCGDLEYDEGTDIVYLKNVPFSGKCKTYYEDNALEREVDFIDGKEHGASKSYYRREKEVKSDSASADPGKRVFPGNKTTEDKTPEEPRGQLQTLTPYNMGVPEGTWEYYYPDGKLAWKNSYVAGVKNGRFSWYFENGNPKKVETYLNGLKDGEYITYYEGKDSTFRKSEIHYKAGKLDGSYKLFYENGQLKSEEKFIADQVDGESLMYYENGQMAIQQKFKSGKPDGEWREWHDNGQERKVEKYVNGKREGEQKQYFKEGNVKSIAVFKADKMISLEEYDEFGNKLDNNFVAPETNKADDGKKKKKRDGGGETGNK
jgi:antitoxin component YwqK of YwqJK toxin-antitoxin module